MKHHSDKQVLAGGLVLSAILLLIGFFSIILALAIYFVLGLLVYVAFEGESEFVRTVWLWLPAILLDKPELMTDDDN